MASEVKKIITDQLNEIEQKSLFSINYVDVLMDTYDRIFATAYLFQDGKWNKLGYGYLDKHGSFILWNQKINVFQYKDIKKRTKLHDSNPHYVLVAGDGEIFLLHNRYDAVIEKLIR